MRLTVIAFLVGMALLNSLGVSAATETVVHSFTGVPTDGWDPQAALISKNGNLYGTTSGGGDYNYGVLFSLDPRNGTEKVLHSFGNAGDGIAPLAPLLDVQGILYGTTGDGGVANAGTVFSIGLKHRAEVVLYSFCAQQQCVDGRYPEVGLIRLNGKLYGTTANGGNGGCDLGCGTVFSLDLQTVSETVVYAFCAMANCADGQNPVASLIKVNGALYGTVGEGGTGECSPWNGCGAVFTVDPETGEEIVLHSFINDGKDGIFPHAGLLRVKEKLYGTTSQGGASPNCYGGCGTIFAIDLKTGVESVVHSFDGVHNDAEPVTGLINVKGLLYGTTGAPGTVYSFDPGTGGYNVLYMFCSKQNCTDGAGPLGTLLDVNGTLYGTTYEGGASTNCEDGCGTVFAIRP